MPNNPFNCDEAMIIAAADVNPPVTGIDTNSTIHPIRIEEDKNHLDVIYCSRD